MTNQNDGRSSDFELRDIVAELLTDQDDMVSIGKDDFLPGLPLPTDVFVRLTNGKFVLIAKRGTKSSLAELHVAQSRDVVHFFVRQDDYPAVVTQNLKIASILARRADIPVARRTGFLRTAADTLFKQIEYMGLDQASLEAANQTVSAICSLVQTKDDYIQVALAVEELPVILVKHSIVGAALSVLIGRELGWKTQTHLEKLALGAFLRDIGFKELPPDLYNMDRLTMTTEERAQWETHAFRGAEMLQRINGIPVEVMAIVLEHHENSIGQGFPRRIRDLQIHPFAKVVALADAFVCLTMPGKESKTPEQAVQHIEYTLGCPYNKACLVAMKRALGLEKESKPSKP